MMKQLRCSALLLITVLVAQPTLAGFASYEEVQVPSILMKKLKSFEPSAATYLADLDAYLISSDDTDKKETPFLFLMNEQGQVAKHPLRVEGLKEITDIESLSQDGNGRLYLLSSLSLNKKGIEKASRNIFAQVTRKGEALKLDKQVDLRSLLIAAIEQSRLPELKSITGNLEAELDIESHVILNGELYVGVKNPQPRAAHALILNLGRVDVLLNDQRIEKLSVWRTIDFSEAGSECLLSDMIVDGNEMYMSTTSDKGEPGYLWHLDLTTGSLSKVDRYDGVKPEGLALRAKDGNLMMVFDQGADPALFHIRSRL